jgi:Flp pilus assembly protein CpaB
MTQVGTPRAARHDAGTTPGGRDLSVRPRRGLPSGRAVMGGFLVALATVGVFAAYTSAVAGPAASYVVAARDLAPGDRIGATDVRLVPIDLPDDQRARSYDQIDPLLDTTVIEPMLSGEIIQEGSLIATGAAPGTRTVSFAMEAPRAVSGTLKAGERVDLLATFGSGDQACTHLIGGDVPIVAVSEATGSLVAQGGLTVTVEVADADQGLAVAHAANAGTITLVRTTHAEAADIPRFCTPAADDAEQAPTG